MGQATPSKTKRNLKILELRDKKGMTMENIAKIMQISRARICQIYHREKERGNNPFLFFKPTVKKKQKKKRSRS